MIKVTLALLLLLVSLRVLVFRGGYTAALRITLSLGVASRYRRESAGSSRSAFVLGESSPGENADVRAYVFYSLSVFVCFW